MQARIFVKVKVNGRSWRPVKAFAQSGPTDHHYVIKRDGSKTTIVFGDGVHGAQPPPGSSVEATYRIGSGKTGNVAAENAAVTYRYRVHPTLDQALWVAIRNRTHTISFNRHRRFVSGKLKQDY
jgi:hypothetical protein